MLEAARRPGSSVLMLALYFSWAVALLGYGIISFRRHGAEVLQPFAFDGQVLQVMTTGGDTLNLFAPGHSYAVLFVSSNCSICSRDSKDLLRVLRGMPADRRAIVSMDLPETLSKHDQGLLEDRIPIAAALDQVAISSLQVAAVPSFLVTNTQAKVTLATMGKPTLWDRLHLRFSRSGRAK